MNPDLYNSLSRLIEYPEDDFQENLKHCLKLTEKHHLKKVDGLRSFAHTAKCMNLSELEEYYTRTFDINPVTALEVGWHLYGETYERGSFLVKMRNLSKKLNISESRELPDHLAHLLKLLGPMEEQEARQIISQYLLPGIKKMIEGFENKENIFEGVFITIRDILQEEPLATGLRS
ncbi:MAG: nitrate reductase molybdenum cofactor assembly chaperone [Deltaproteobacteria bacterium RIFCSPLOWO2_02_FULL_50_16]|nr:MAG: nitrate reductase molybdenum cofactor assembly chaperone [Deltaproteobacteria bacterium GWA2_50_8]OGQ26343.1 MAG: nitrate reductase molybdenum cofactor assembly chaperone [Deltaproteobacteria bacterium RIFCSPHIGHO2_02_FULL_50_15]OGQ56669.1 MAG: nitrate reductase molybdenum cofactor assembly chaperone [Deltaproteobacteria bacterium RIFCSPLOWO2_02_FULL_50_16]